MKLRNSLLQIMIYVRHLGKINLSKINPKAKPINTAAIAKGENKLSAIFPGNKRCHCPKEFVIAVPRVKMSNPADQRMIEHILTRTNTRISPRVTALSRRANPKPAVTGPNKLTIIHDK